jgi:hypothetical protein
MFVRRKDEARLEARRLRGDLGWSLAPIAQELGVAKSSVSVWVRDLGQGRATAMPARPPDALPTRRLRVWKSGRVRRCGRCGHELPWECFNRLGEGVQWWCRSCFAAYFRARGDLHRRQSKTAKLARQRAMRAHVLEYLLRHPCVDCGERDPVVLEFDHIEEKSAHVSDLISHCASKTAIDAEIARCEVVCTNCHRRRTAHRAGWRRAAIDESPVRPHLNRHVARNFAHLLAILRRSACVDCGVSDPLILEFDHVGRKRAAVTRLAWHGCSIATIDTEIRECEIRCASCHRRRTAMKGGHFRFRVLSSTSPP